MARFFAAIVVLATVTVANASASALDFTRSVVVTPGKLTRPEEKAIAMLIEAVHIALRRHFGALLFFGAFIAFSVSESTLYPGSVTAPLFFIFCREPMRDVWDRAERPTFASRSARPS